MANGKYKEPYALVIIYLPVLERLQVPLEIKRASYDQASLIIMQSEDDARKYKWKVSIRKVSTPTGPVFYTPTQEYTGTFTTFNFPLSFEAGHQYQVTVSPVLEEGMHQGTDIFRTQVVEFKAGTGHSSWHDLFRRLTKNTVECARDSSICSINVMYKFFCSDRMTSILLIFQ